MASTIRFSRWHRIQVSVHIFHAFSNNFSFQPNWISSATVAQEYAKFWVGIESPVISVVSRNVPIQPNYSITTRRPPFKQAIPNYAPPSNDQYVSYSIHFVGNQLLLEICHVYSRNNNNPIQFMKVAVKLNHASVFPINALQRKTAQPSQLLSFEANVMNLNWKQVQEKTQHMWRWEYPMMIKWVMIQSWNVRIERECASVFLFDLKWNLIHIQFFLSVILS